MFMNGIFSPIARLRRPEAAPRKTGDGPGVSRRAVPASGSAARPHICFVAPSTWPVISGDTTIPLIGGAEVQQGVIAPALAARGYKVSMVCLDFGQPDRAEVQGITVHKLYRPDEGIRVVRFVHPRLTTLWRVLREVDADIYYQRSAAATTGFMAAFCRRYGKRSIYAGACDHDFLPGRQDIQYARDRWLFDYGVRHADRVFVQNPTQRDLLRAHYGREGVLIPNCYANKSGARADPAGYVLWVATVRAQKRPEVLLEMARRLPQYRFVIVGGADPDRAGQEYARGIREAAVQLANVEYRGFMPFAEADRVFDGARVVVSTSPYEGFPNVFLQGWARGAPTVAFVDTGSRDPDGRAPYDIVADLDQASARVERLMRDDAAWRQASNRVLAHFERHHSVEAAMARYEAQIAELVPAR